MEPEAAADGQNTQTPSQGSIGKQRLHLLLPSLEMKMKTKRKMKMNKTKRKSKRKMKKTNMKMKTMAQDASTAQVHPQKG